MKKVEWFWNMIHYMLYRWDVNFSIALNYALPFYWINKIPAIKRYKEKNGMPDMNGFYREMMNNPKHGSSIIWAGSGIGIISVLLTVSIFNVLQILLDLNNLYSIIFENILYTIIYLIFIIIPGYFICNKFLFKNDKYLEYFNEFDQIPKNKKIIWGFITLLLIIFAIGSFWGSLVLIH
ncbi:hypothetical protein [uncultured Bacteroides sp.]|jgi:hypothetical protein|uniref:hypothetical protein n=1 Tax=uncultured Bacteroides sp. TaxID=162156 RepID=UPI002AA63F7D|nr:hypothetical protein [uncultured Bacteroides sp.]